MSIQSVMPSNHLILCRRLLFLSSIFPSIKVLSNESMLCIRWPNYWSFSFSISPPNEYLDLISFRMDWLDLLAVQGTLKSILQQHSSKASILQCSAFFIVQFSYPYMTTGKTIALTRWEAEHQRIDVFQLWCQRILKVLWTARRSKQFIFWEINLEYSLEGLILELKLQQFGHLFQTDDLLDKSLMLGKIKSRRRRGYQRMRWMESIINAMNMNLGKLWEMVRDMEACHDAVHGVTKGQT